MDENITIPVIRRNGVEEGLFIKLDRVIYLITNGREIEIHTPNDVYFTPMPLNFWEMCLNPLGFEKLDRINIVRMSKIIRFDEKLFTVYFEGTSKFGTVSRTNAKRFFKGTR